MFSNICRVIGPYGGASSHQPPPSLSLTQSVTNSFGCIFTPRDGLSSNILHYTEISHRGKLCTVLRIPLVFGAAHKWHPRRPEFSFSLPLAETESNTIQNQLYSSSPSHRFPRPSVHRSQVPRAGGPVSWLHGSSTMTRLREIIHK